MSAFSYQCQPLDLESMHLQSSQMRMSGQIIEEPNNNKFTTTCFPHQYYQSELLHQQVPTNAAKNIKITRSNNETSVTNKTSTDSSSVLSDKPESGEQVTQKVTAMDKKRKFKGGSSANPAQTLNEIGDVKGRKQKKSSKVVKENEETPKEEKKDNKRAAEAAPTGFIHVRARRGQATDSHSLAERVRREKISERMKLLQALVPGCDKVTGKALMLDEIINYVQSLQNQVEFLSMKLAYLNPIFHDFGMDLDSFMARPDQTLGDLEIPVQNMEQCEQMQQPIISDTRNLATANTYSQLDNSASVLFQQSHIPQILSQDNGQLLWDVDDQRQKLINQSGLISNNLCLFH